MEMENSNGREMKNSEEVKSDKHEEEVIEKASPEGNLTDSVKNNAEESIENKEPLDEHDEHKEKKKHRKGPEKEIENLKYELTDLKDKYLRIYSEFDNFRKRTSKEKLDLIKSASEDLIVSLLPVLDDFERAIKAMSEKENVNESSVEGIQHIFNKLKYINEQRGLKEMAVSKGDEFNAELHEAITKIPVEDEDLKGKIVDVLEKGYYLNDKVIRFAKVVTGS